MAPDPSSGAFPPADPGRAGPRPPGGAFRARLDRDPRRFVLLLAALEGAAAFALDVQERRDMWLARPGALFLLAALAVAPAAGALGMLAHGRLIFWTGRLLRGRAAPCEIHAAFAWSQLPLAVAAIPLIVEIPLHVAALGADPLPPWLSRARDGLDYSARAVFAVAVIAAIGGVIRWVRYLAVAQRFSAWRALANELLAGLLGVVIVASAVSIALVLQPGANAIERLPLMTALMVALPLGVERLVVFRRRAVARRGRT